MVSQNIFAERPLLLPQEKNTIESVNRKKNFIVFILCDKNNKLFWLAKYFFYPELESLLLVFIIIVHKNTSSIKKNSGSLFLKYVMDSMLN